MKFNHDIPELYKAFEIAQRNLRPKFGDSLTITPLISNLKTVSKAFNKQWKPILDRLNLDDPDDWKLNRSYYTALFEAINYFECVHFNVAVWHGDTLCAVAQGGYKNERDYDYTSVHVRQAHPAKDHPLKGKVGYALNEIAKEYADQFNKKKIVYVGPYSEGAIKTHERMGLKQEVYSYGNGGIDMAYVCNF